MILMAAVYCICPKCGIKFNRNAIQAVKVGPRRYGHATCYPDNKDFVEMEVTEKKKPITKSDEELEDLKNYIKTLFGEKTNWARVTQQIKQFQKDGYSLTGIKKSLVYFYEVKKNPIDKANGSIGIVPFCYQDAYNYYLSLYLAQQSMEQDKTIINTVKEIIIKPFKSKGLKKKFFNLGDFEE